MGAAAALRAVAMRHVEPDAMVLECPFDRMISTIENRFSAMGAPAFPAAHLLVFWGGVQQGFNGFSHNPKDYARQVRVPTLLLHGERDDRVTVAEARSIHDNLQGPRTFVVIPGIGHQSYVRARPREWKTAVSAFLGRFSPSS